MFQWTVLPPSSSFAMELMLIIRCNVEMHESWLLYIEMCSGIRLEMLKKTKKISVRISGITRDLNRVSTEKNSRALPLHQSARSLNETCS
jgi:hypothetical protein